MPQQIGSQVAMDQLIQRFTNPVMRKAVRIVIDLRSGPAYQELPKLLASLTALDKTGNMLEVLTDCDRLLSVANATEQKPALAAQWLAEHIDHYILSDVTRDGFMQCESWFGITDQTVRAALAIAFDDKHFGSLNEGPFSPWCRKRRLVVSHLCDRYGTARPTVSDPRVAYALGVGLIRVYEAYITKDNREAKNELLEYLRSMTSVNLEQLNERLRKGRRGRDARFLSRWRAVYGCLTEPE